MMKAVYIAVYTISLCTLLVHLLCSIKEYTEYQKVQLFKCFAVVAVLQQHLLGVILRYLTGNTPKHDQKRQKIVE